MRKRKGALALVLAAVALALPISTAGAGDSADRSAGAARGNAAAASGTGEFVVSYAAGIDAATAQQAITDAGGTVVDEIAALGLATVHTDDAGFSDAVLASGVVDGVARNHSVGLERQGMKHHYAVERDLEARASAGSGAGSSAAKPGAEGPETFSHLQWDMEMINASDAHATATGDGVLVGIIDTGIDASHPDLAPNFNLALSENFTTDKEDIDGPCSAETDGSCEDPPYVDEGGHGTHVSGTVAADDNGSGIMGVAPDASLVNLRAGQDSGFFFFFETVDALVAAGDRGIDVVNMSFYTDPWLYNCASEADYISGDVSDAEIAQQAMIRQGLLDAVAYARNAGVTLVSAAGNSAFDLHAEERPDGTSPDYPLGTEHDRVVTDNCLDLPSEAPGVIQVSALGPSTNKADYSNYGFEEIDVSAPGGWFRDFIHTSEYRKATNMVLSSYPESVATGEGVLTKSGNLKDPRFFERDCGASGCAYYTYFQGTSMAAPHVTGVVALIIEAYRDANGGASPTPDQVTAILTSTATDTPCPAPEDLVYTDEGRPASWTAHCEGTPAYNGIYGDGIVDAAAAVGGVLAP